MNFEYRKAQRDAHCRECDKIIKRGEFMLSGYSWRNRGMNMHFHPECIVLIRNLIPEEKTTSKDDPEEIICY